MAKASRPQQANFTVDPADVQRLDEMSLKWTNLLRLKLEANKADKQQRDIFKEVSKLQGQELANAKKYLQNVQGIERLEKNLQRQRAAGNAAGIRSTQKLIDGLKVSQQQLAKTTGGALRAQEVAAAKQKANLQAERNLIKAINKERGLGGKIMDLFRTKEQRQRQIDLARAKVGGGANVSTGAGGAGASAGLGAALAGNPLVAAAAAVAGVISKAVNAAMAPMKALGSIAQKAIVAPFADAAQLLTGEDFGMGGGKLKTSGPSSILGGIQEFASSIPIIGGLLGGIVGIVKTIVEGILGIEQGVFRFARAMNITYGQAERMKASFAAIAASSGHIAINETRMMQSQAEIGTQLAINKQLSGDILKNDVLLRDVLGIEAETRQTIAKTTLTAGRDAVQLTRSLMRTVDGFNKITKAGFSFNGIMKEASKLTGIIGLQFAKYPEKITRTLMAAKALGMELQQLDGVANSLLDFESSISAEMEAQVLTGKEMNLTLAREAALSNDYATLTQEIAKNVGSTEEFLGMNRIQQEAIAKSVGMTANSLADVLKNQKIYNQLGATDLKGFHEKIALLERQGKTQEQISAMIGKDAYNEYTRISTAERITETLEKMKRTFVELIKSSGIFDFITKPERVTAFVRGLADKLASVIDIVGRIVAGIMEGVAYVVGLFSDQKAAEIRALAGSVRSGTGTFAESMRIATGTLGGVPAPSVGATAEKGARAAGAPAPAPAPVAAAPTFMNQQPFILKNYMVVDGKVVAENEKKYGPMDYGRTGK